MVDPIQKRFEDAARYDAMMANVFAGYEQLPAIALSYLRTWLGPQARVLDVGCGTGATLAALAAHQPEWSLVGVDPAGPMLELARSKLAALGLGDRVELIQGTLAELADEPRFDAAISILVEHLLPDDGTKLRFLEGMQRRLVPGGRLVLVGLHGDLATEVGQRALDAWVEFVALRGLPQAAQADVKHRATIEDSLATEERLRELFEQAGFVDVDRVYHVHLVGGWRARKARTPSRAG